MKKYLTAVAAIMLMATVAFSTGCKKYDNAEGDGTINGHTYVDLGLPSGTLWAACNVGANAPEEYGDYFAWGETTPKTTYGWSNYKYCDNGHSHRLTKYCGKTAFGYNGFTDTLTVLQTSDDAATANWGSGWCTPTKDQWKELLDNTTSTLTTSNGVNGCLFTAANGNSLFLPAAGDRWDDEHNYAGNNGYYWSSSLYADYPNYARNFYFFSLGDINLGHFDRSDGRSVRPVRSSHQN